MAKYAVARIKGRQYKVSEGEEILVDKFTDPKTTPEVLLVVDGEKISIGKPVLKDAVIKIKVLKDKELGEKIYVSKYKAKSRYRRRIGFRPQYSRILVEKITL